MHNKRIVQYCVMYSYEYILCSCVRVSCRLLL